MILAQFWEQVFNFVQPLKELYWYAVRQQLGRRPDMIGHAAAMAGVTGRYLRGEPVSQVDICTMRPVARNELPSAKTRTAVSKIAGSASRP